MKKLLIILSLFVSSCQSNKPHQPIAEIIDGRKDGKSIIEVKNQFTSKSLNKIDDRKKKVKIALFLPFSGENKELGWDMANSAFMSLFNHDDDRNIELVLVDSKGNPKEAKELFSQIVKDQIKIVIGPIFSSVAQEIKEDATNNNI
ncbi:MAG: ABC transporter substrate-binding protein, partial [Rickettsiales bacterium]|nr:ABC transporter substrate-binding protein [Rickettsiales bacterium]